MVTFGMTLPNDLSKCLVLNTIAAARTLLRRYDAKLKPFGVTAQQFWLLAAIRFYPGEPVATLAQRVSRCGIAFCRNGSKPSPNSWKVSRIRMPRPTFESPNTYRRRENLRDCLNPLMCYMVCIYT